MTAEHLQRVESILRAIGGDVPAPLALIALEDAHVAIMMGHAMGLTLDRIVPLACQILTERSGEMMRNDVPPQRH